MKQQRPEQLIADVRILVKVVKRTFSTLQALPQHQPPPDTPQLLQNIAEENKYLLQILRKHKQVSPQQQQIVEKMKNNIKEWLAQTKIKYQSSPAFKQLKGLCQQLEVSLKLFQKTNNFHQLVTKLYTTINEQLRVFKIKLDLFKKGQQSSEMLSLGLKRVHSLGNKPLNPSIRQNKSVNLSVLYRIELDNQHIRSVVLLSQRGQIQWLHTQLDRNKHTQQHIENYNRLVFLFSQKQKNRIKPLLGVKAQNKQNIRVKTTAQDKHCFNFNPHRTRREDSKQKENIFEESLKGTYKVNNLYVSGNEFNIYCQSGKKRAPQSYHQRKKSSLLLCKAFRDSLTTKNGHQHSRELSKFLK